MSRSLQRIISLAFATIFSVAFIATPVFAVPEDQAPAAPETGETENPEETPEEEQPEEEEEASTCYDQVGALGWIVCPGGSLLASSIDGLYGVIEDLLVVKPISTDHNTPFYLVWNYLRNIANILFIAFFMFVIYSQLTGYGINNYGIKRILPRLIIAAILVNLSYIICTLTVDVSNILGVSLRQFLGGIVEDALTNGTISAEAAATNFGSVTAAVIGGGTLLIGGAYVTASLAGGLMGVLWMLLPVLLSGAIAILSAFVTLAARQALVILLVMVSPLAFLAYLLPNTEKWFDKWKKMLFSMLVFFPTFSLLFGACRLAGLIMITSATGLIGLILGLAVMVIPLFMAIPLMRMSGTALGKIDGLIHRAGQKPQAALSRISSEHQEIAKKNHLANPNNRGIARWMHNREVIRANDLKHANDMLSSKDSATAARSHYNRDGTLNKRGLRYYGDQGRIMAAKNEVSRFDTDMDEGFNGDGSDKRIRAADRGAINRANTHILSAVDQGKILAGRAESVRLQNAQSSADRIQNALKDIDGNTPEEEAQREDIRRMTAQAFNYEHKTKDEVNSMSATERDQYDKTKRPAVSAILSNAINEKRIADANMKKQYTEYYDDLPAGPEVKKILSQSFDDLDYNSMSAAIQVMAKRGDYADIESVLRDKSAALRGDGNVKAQKQLAETLLGYKHDDVLLWAWGKSLLMRRGMHEAGSTSPNGPELDGYIDFKTFDEGGTGDTDIAGSPKIQKVSRIELIKGIDDASGIGKTQDRTFFKSLYENRVNGNISDVHDLGLTMKQLRSTAVSGRDGEALETINTLITGGFTKISKGTASAEEINYFNNNSAGISANMVELVGQMSASQVASLKTDTVKDVNAALLRIHGDGFTNASGVTVSRTLYNMVEKQRDALNLPNMSSQRNSMNETVRKMLGINLS